MPATGGDPETLLDPSISVRHPRLLPGGRAVIFTDEARLSTYLLDLDTDSVRLLRAGAIDAVYVETGHLLYTDVSGTLWAVEFDLRRGEVVGEPVTMLAGLTLPRPAFTRLSVSREGTLVYAVGGSLAGGAGGGQRLLEVDLEGNVEPLVLPPREIRTVNWSPDGRSVVYVSAEGGIDVRAEGGIDIYTYNVELGTTPRQLTFEGTNRRPVFSPDGTRVAFASLREGTHGVDLFVKTLDDDALGRSIITLPGDQFPTQWPSDTLIVFESGTPSDLWMLDLSDPDSARAQAYLSAETFLFDLVVSPDGMLAAYESRESGQSEIYIRSFPGPGERTFVSQGGGRSPFWSPDGNTLYYWTLDTSLGVNTFWAALIQRNPTPVVLSRDSLFKGNYAQFASDLHPDGDRIVVAQNVLIGDSAAPEPERFLVVTNFFEELRQRMGN